MTIRLKATVSNGEVRLVLPEGRHLERDGWYVAADIFAAEPRLLVLRVWAPDNAGFRVIVIDPDGTEYDSIRARTYQEARAAIATLNGSERSFPKIDGRRLVSGGDADWEIAAEIRPAGQEELLFLRVWLQAKQEFTVYAIDATRRVRGHDTAATRQKAYDAIISHLTR